MTPDERAADQQRRTEFAAWWGNLFSDCLPAEPACWSWPVVGHDVLRARWASTSGVAALMPAETVERWARQLDGGSLIEVWQAGRCAVCGRDQRVVGELVTDHDHRTGLVRGKLCRSCNGQEARGVGPLWDGYRVRPPAVLLGITARYWSAWTGWAEPEPEVDRRAAAERIFRAIGL